MHRVSRALLLLAVLGALAVGAFLALGRPGAEASPDPTITVNSTGDTNSRDSVITLREAMMLATGGLALTALKQGECGQVSGAYWVFPPVSKCLSADPPGAASADTIVFATGVFPPGSPATITLGSGLPSLNSGGDSVDGSSAGVIVNCPDDVCFDITSDNNTIKGLQIYYGGFGVFIHGGAQSNTIGGSTAVERNVISGNSLYGVRISDNGTAGNTVKGNYIGTNAAGDARLDNRVGVSISQDAQSNTVGGSTEGERNVISANSTGVELSGNVATGHTNLNAIKGNYIGVNAAGTAALGNAQGVRINGGSQNNTIGGSTAGERNVISANAGAAEGNLIAFNSSGDGVRVRGNSIGNRIRGNSIHSNGAKGIDNTSGGNTELAPPAITGFGSVMGTACPNCIIDVYSDDEDEGRVYEGSTTADNAGDWTFEGSPEGPNVTATATDAAGNTSEFSAPVAVPEATPTPTPTLTPTPTPPATPGATPTPAGPTRTVQWGPGWNNATWSGASTPEEVFACAAGKYAAAYRYVAGGLERYFPGRPDISNMGPLAQYDAFLILTQPVTCVMPVTAASGSSRTLQWSVGWNNAGWSGPDGTPPEQAFACAEGSYAAAYRYVAGGLERYFPGRPDISNMGPLNRYDAFLILLAAPVTCTMPVGP